MPGIGTRVLVQTDAGEAEATLVIDLEECRRLLTLERAYRLGRLELLL
jgi:hypothetical protein